MLDLFKSSWRTQTEVRVNDVSKEVTMVVSIALFSSITKYLHADYKAALNVISAAGTSSFVLSPEYTSLT